MTDFLAGADYESVRVHLTGTDVELGGGHQPGGRKKIVTRFGTETVDNTNLVRPLLPDAPARVCAWVQATGADVYLCDTESKAIQAAGAVNSGLGTLLPHGNAAPWPLRGQQAVWIAQVSTSTSSSVVSFTADIEE